MREVSIHPVMAVLWSVEVRRRFWVEQKLAVLAEAQGSNGRSAAPSIWALFRIGLRSSGSRLSYWNSTT